jgi:hypothetical protein
MEGTPNLKALEATADKGNAAVVPINKITVIGDCSLA